MRKMKDSGIVRLGQIPEHWAASRIKYLYSVIGSGTTPQSGNMMYYDGEKHWIQSGDLYKTKYIVDTEKKITEFAEKTISALKLYKADFIVVAMYGASIGNVSISKIDACVNQACCVIKPNERVDFNYLYYSLVNDKDIMLDMSIGGTQPNISQAKILEIPVMLPPLPEQTKIADFLDAKCADIDQIRTDVEKQIEILTDYKKSVITEAVTKGLDPKAKMKDSGIKWIGKIPDVWNVIRLKNASWLKGRIGWQGLRAEEFTDEGPFLITGTDFKNGYVNWKTCVHISEQRFYQDLAIQIKENDLLITKDGTIGKLAIAKNCPEKVSLNSGVFIIRNTGKYKYDDKFMYYLLQSRVFTLWFDLSNAGNSTISHLNQEKFYNFKFAYPPISEQKAIADYLDEKCSEIDAAIAEKQKQLETLEEYKKSLIFEYVTGKKEVV